MATRYELLTTKEVAERFRVKPETVREWVRVGKLPAQRLGWRTLRFTEEDLEAFSVVNMSQDGAA